MTAFTISDTFCSFTYKLQLWSDLNTDTVQDANEFLDVTQTAETASGPIFYKASNADRAFHINRLMPVTNTQVGVYYLKGIAQVQNSGAISTQTITFTIVKNCDVETLTPPASISDVFYTFKAAAVTVTLPQITSSNPTLCPVTHDLEVKDPAFTAYATSSFASLLAYTASTRTLVVSYTVDNRFSPLDTTNLIELRIHAKMDN